MTDPKNLNKCCPSNDGNVGNAIACIIKTIKLLEKRDSVIENGIDEEKSRAIDAENILQQHIEEELNRAQTKEEEILLALNNQNLRTEQTESTLNTKIETEVAAEEERAVAAEQTLDGKIDQEIQDRKDDVDTEEARAKDAEEALDAKIELESTDRQADVDEEQTRAEAAELALSNKIDLDIQTERTRAIDAETLISSNLTDEIAAREQAITNVINSIPEAQILPDWNLSDVNAKDYIKNKPHALDGKSAYELAVDNGFEGAEQEWLASLKGEQGVQGIQGEQGPAGQDGSDGADGQDGAPGLDGHSPVVTASKSGSTTTIYVDGTSIATIEDGLDGQDGLNGTNGTNGANGLNGVTPHIDSTSKHWMIGSTDTGIVAEGQNGSNGTNGQDGVTPHIDSTTGNWFIGTTDTGVHAQGPAGLDGSNGANGSNGQDGHSPVITASKSNGVTTVSVDGTPIATINDGQNGSDGTNGLDGQNGITPHIDSITKHWMIGETDTGVVAEGLNVADPVTQSELLEVEKVTAIALTNLDERVSDLENDSVSTSSNYYDKSEIDLMFVNAASGGSVDLSGYAKTADLATIATSGSYNDLSNKPTIPQTGKLLEAKESVYVDLGLTSGTLWATMNVGAATKSDVGNYYMWGKGDKVYNSSDAINAEVSLWSSDDTAKKVFGSNWSTPTREQWQELVSECTLTWGTVNGVLGCTLSKNSKSIFFPVSGRYYQGDLIDSDRVYYWGSSTDNTSTSCEVHFYLSEGSATEYIGNTQRSYGIPIRPVTNVASNIAPSKVAFSGSYNDLAYKPTLATVATTGSYNDLTDKPATPDDLLTSYTELNPTSSNPIDLNDLDSGVYVYNYTYGTSQYFSNVPTYLSNSFELIVEKRDNVHSSIQTLKLFDTVKNKLRIYFRIEAYNTWSDWDSLMTDYLVINKLDGYYKLTGSDTIIDVETVTTLDSVTTLGYHSWYGHASRVSQLNGKPTSNNTTFGLLVFEIGGNSNCIHLRYQEYDSLDVYERRVASYSAGVYTWTNWELVQTANAASIWRGTQAQYDLLTPDNNTIYIITTT